MQATPAPFNVAVIGYGLSAKIFHIPLLLALPESYRLHTIVQRTATSNNSASADHPNAQIHSSYTDLLSSPDISAISLAIVTTPPSTHYEIASACLNAGLNVVVEKPFAPTSAQAASLVALARSRNKVLTVYQNRRWDQDFLTLQKLLAEKTLGDVVEFETHYDRFRPVLPPPQERTWKLTDLEAGGALWDLGSHLLDQVHVLFGPPESVMALVSVQKRGLIAVEKAACPPDFCTVILEYAQDLIVTVKCSGVSAEGRQLRYWVRGSAGSFKKYGLDVQEEQLKGGMKMQDAGFGEESQQQFGTLSLVDGSGFEEQRVPSVKPALYVQFYKSLATALSGRGEVPVKPEDAAAVIRIIELAEESSKTGRKLQWFRPRNASLRLAGLCLERAPAGSRPGENLPKWLRIFVFLPHLSLFPSLTEDVVAESNLEAVIEESVEQERSESLSISPYRVSSSAVSRKSNPYNMSRRACYKCGNIGHFAEVCSSSERLCYNCKQPGHESNLCPHPRTTETKQCYHCQGLGHVQADCPTLRLNGGSPGGRCYSCGQIGHVARLCTSPVGPGAGPGAGRGFAAPRGGFGGSFRGGFAGVNRGANCYKCGGPNHFARDCQAGMMKCYACGKLGHISRDCTSPSGGPLNVGGKTCYTCGQPGHISRECPEDVQVNGGEGVLLAAQSGPPAQLPAQV